MRGDVCGRGRVLEELKLVAANGRKSISLSASRVPCRAASLDGRSFRQTISLFSAACLERVHGQRRSGSCRSAPAPVGAAGPSRSFMGHHGRLAVRRKSEDGGRGALRPRPNYTIASRCLCGRSGLRPVNER
jgi:hypothetical protein